MTGFCHAEFDAFVIRLTPLWSTAEEERLFRTDRVRATGAGHPYHLATLEDKLLVVLMWYRLYCIYDLLGLVFDMDGSNICRLIRRMKSLIEAAADPTLRDGLVSLQKNVKEIQKRKKITTWEELIKHIPELEEVIIDSTEQPRKRPVNQKKQKNRYSGKKKRHTVKTQITITTTGKILDVSKSYPGRIHDKRILEREKTLDKIPKKTKKRMDTGYDGTQKNHPDHCIILPHKRRRNSPLLTRGQKNANTKRAKKRILVENVLSRVKKYQVIAQIYRSDERDYNQDFRNVAALTNYRLAWRQQQTSVAGFA